MKKKQVALGHGNYLGFSSILVKMFVQIPNKGVLKNGLIKVEQWADIFATARTNRPIEGPLIARPIKLKHPIMARTCSRA